MGQHSFFLSPCAQERDYRALVRNLSFQFHNYSSPFWLLTIMGKGLPSFDKEGMPESDSGPRQGWLESARDCQPAAFPDHPILDFVSATPPHPS